MSDSTETTGSALVGSPPATQDDYWIVKGMLRAIHIADKFDAVKGYTFLAQRPADYEHEDKQTGIIIGMAVCIFVMTFITGARLALRFFRTGLRWGADDWVLIPGAVMAIAYPALQIAMVIDGGGGRHIWDVTYEEYNVFNWLGVTCKILFFTSVGIIKISITLFNRRLTGMASRIWRILNDVFLFLLTVYTLLALFWTCFQCNPPPAMWNKIYAGQLSSPATCWTTSTISNVLSVIHVVMDFCLLMTPIIVLWKVKLPTTTKVRLYLVFSTGAVSCVGSVLRQLAQQKIDRDVTWAYTSILAWTLVDLTFGVLTASLPVLVGLIPSAWRSVSARTGGTSGSRRRRPTTTTAGNNEDDGDDATSDEGGILVEQEFELTFHEVEAVASKESASASASSEFDNVNKR